MNEHDAQRFLDEQRYQAELPFPVSAVFTHYARSSTKNYAIRSLQLVATAQSTIRYAAIAAACDYSTNPDSDESVLNWLRQEWLGGKKPSFGTWYGALMRLLAESGKTWKNPFIPEFGDINRELLEKKIQPLIHGRNVEIGHAEYYEALALKHFVELQEENLFAVMEQFSFLSRYPLAFAEVEDDYEPPSPGTKQAVNICRGASHNFARYTVALSHPLPPGMPFIWNSEYTGILTLAPFLIYGRATTDAEQKERVKGVAHIQGLMVLNGVPKGSTVYTSVDAEAQFSLDSFEFPPKEKIQEQVDSALKKGLDVPARREARLTAEEKEIFVRTTDYVTPAFENESALPLKRKTRWVKSLLAAVVGGIIVVAGFALYSRFMAPKATVSEKQEITSIAVLAFDDMSPNRDQEWFGDGMADAIIDKLTPIHELRVIARNSAFSFKGKRPDIRDVGKKLDVEHVLEGSVIKFENTIRVTAQLIRVADNSHIWSNRYDSETKNMLAVQDSISLAIVEALKVNLAKHEQAAMERRPTNNQEAYELYLMGNKYIVPVGKKEEYEKALVYFQRAVALDPQFAEAYLGIAWSYRYLSDIPNARKFLEKSLGINNKLPKAYILKAFIFVAFDWNFPAAEENYKKALSLNPGLAEAQFFYAQYLRVMGRYDEALGEIERARESDPLYIPTYAQAMAIYMELDRFDKAMEMYRKAEEIDPGNLYTRMHQGRLYNFTGRYEEALKIFQEGGRILGTDPTKNFRIGVTYALWGKRDKAEEIINALQTDKGNAMGIAYIYAALGDNDRTFEWLEKAYRNRDSYLGFLKVELEFRKIRSDPRFNVMLKKIGFPE